MKWISLAFLIGTCTLYGFSKLPDLKFYVILTSILSSLLFFIHSGLLRKIIGLVIVFLLGLIWVVYRSTLILAWQVPEAQINQPVEVEGTIASIPSFKFYGISFLFKLKSFNGTPTQAKVRLTWPITKKKPEPYLRVGDEWSLTVRLKPPHGLVNPGSPDIEKLYFARGIRAMGSVRVQSKNNFIRHHADFQWMDQIRQRLLEKMKIILSGKPYAAFIYALTLGEKAEINQDAWQVFQNTGTNHLMAISGLHIGLLTALIFFLVRWIWPQIPYAVRILPQPQASAVIGLIAAFIYSALAGFAIPTQRAVLMITLFLLGNLFRRFVPPLHSLAFALLVVLLINPLSILEIGFWLSFMALSLLAYGLNGRTPQPHSVKKNLKFDLARFFKKYGQPQWVIGIGFIPLTLLFFSNASFISPVANSLAIPWVGFITIPLSLIGALFSFLIPSVGACILNIAEGSLHGIWAILKFLAQVPFFSWAHTVSDSSFIFLGILGCALWLAPWGCPGRGLGAFFILPLLLVVPSRPRENEVWLTLLDVGQGLSAVVSTKNTNLVYDTGGKWAESEDMGRRVVIPFLQFNQIRYLDALIISHGDSDHRGGAESILARFPVAHLMTSVPALFPNQNAQTCLRGKNWEWDHVKFIFLHPIFSFLGDKNNSSCVLKITYEKNAILLTGDIEKKAENLLLHQPDALRAVLLVAPHHGSKTSSTEAFIMAAHPEVVLFPTGYYNRFGFPKEIIVNRYRMHHVRVYDTAQEGAVTIKMNGEKIIEVQSFRKERKPHIWDVI